MFSITQTMLNTISTAQAQLFLNDSPAIVGNSVVPSTNMKLVANSGRLISTARLRYSDSGATKFDDFTIAADELTATLVNAVGAGTKTMQTFVVATKAGSPPAPTPSFTVTQPMLESFANGNAKMLINGVEAKYKDPVYSDSVITGVPIGDNRIFSSASYSYTKSGSTVNKLFILSDDLKLATIDDSDFFLPSILNRSFIIITKVVNPPTPTPEVTGANNIYLVDNNKLTALNKERVYLGSSGLTSSDLGSFILGLISLPFKLNDDLISKTTPNILLGSVKTSVSANKVLVEKIPFDFGFIEVPEIKNNLLDHVNTVCVLHIPYSQSITIDPEYVIGQKIGVVYLIDAYNGEATINISSSKVEGRVFITKQSSLGINVPYILNGGMKSFNSNIDVGGDNKTNKPVIEVMRDTSPIAENFFNSVIKDSGKLVNHSGYVEVDNINISTKALKTEKDMLINILNNGIIIK